MSKQNINNDIEYRLNRIISQRFENYASEVLKDKNAPLLLNGLKASDLLYLYFDIEKEFNIKIRQEFVVNGNFKTINGIIGLINAQLEESSSLKEETFVSVGI